MNLFRRRRVSDLQAEVLKDYSLKRALGPINLTALGIGAVIGAGTIITGSTPVFDLVREQILRKSGESPLIIPRDAVVVPGSRPANGPFAAEHRLQVSCPVIVKYRNETTDATTALEELLR
jgi:2,3,4,5-tetrahydropyridine-2-carboxylate N-succinyltransferase